MLIGIIIFALSFIIQVIACLADKYQRLQFDLLRMPFTDILRIGIIIPCGVAGFLVFSDSIKMFCVIAGIFIAIVMIYLADFLFG